MRNKVKVSIIIPAFNSEKTIKRSILSALRQTLDGVQVVVVDDGSTDSTNTILQSIKQEYPDLLVITQENMGQAIARKNGVLRAEGKYIMFLDSDDFISKNRAEKMYHVAESKKIDILRTSYTKIIKGKKIICKKPNNNSMLTKQKALDILVSGYDFATPVAQLVRRKLFSMETFNGLGRIRYAEDFIMNVRLFEKAHTFAWWNIPDYYYAINDKSFSNSTKLRRQLKNANDALYTYSLISHLTSAENVAYRQLHASLSQIKKSRVSVSDYDELASGLREFRKSGYFKTASKKVIRKRLSIPNRILLRAIEKEHLIIAFLVIRINHIYDWILNEK